MKQNKFKLGCIVLSIIWVQITYAQDENDNTKATLVYQNTSFHEPVQIEVSKLNQNNEAKNIILFIGDGMGVAQTFAGMTANHGKLNLEYLKYIGFSKTQSFNEYVTDSGAGATAIASGVNTYYDAIGVNSDTLKVPSILELAEEKGLSTGLVTTCDITDATPAAFIAHQKSRYILDAVAMDYLNTDVDIVIGGGSHHFTKQSNGQSLILLLKENGYTVITDEEQLSITKGHKIFALLEDRDLPRAKERKNYLTLATRTALNILAQNEKGFFLMIEGSQIDYGGHLNDTGFIVEEMLDLDKAIGTALEFAANNGETLIICTADHETGGMTLEFGNIETGQIGADYTTDDHTGVMVPVYSIGPGAEEFIGIYENTAIFEKMKLLLKL
jgi:alkaline phosphatase